MTKKSPSAKAASSGRVPRDRQIEQSAECPAADPHWRAVDEAEVLQARKDDRQRDVGNHRPRSPGAGAEVRAGAEGNALAGVPADVELVGPLEMLFVAVGRAEHQEYPLLRLKPDAADRPGLYHAPRRHSDRRDPARIFLESLNPGNVAGLEQRQLIRMGEQRPHRAGNRISRL